MTTVRMVAFEMARLAKICPDAIVVDCDGDPIDLKAKGFHCDSEKHDLIEIGARDLWREIRRSPVPIDSEEINIVQLDGMDDMLPYVMDSVKSSIDFRKFVNVLAVVEFEDQLKLLENQPMFRGPFYYVSNHPTQKWWRSDDIRSRYLFNFKYHKTDSGFSYYTTDVDWLEVFPYVKEPATSIVIIPQDEVQFTNGLHDPKTGEVIPYMDVVSEKYNNEFLGITDDSSKPLVNNYESDDEEWLPNH